MYSSVRCHERSCAVTVGARLHPVHARDASLLASVFLALCRLQSFSAMSEVLRRSRSRSPRVRARQDDGLNVTAATPSGTVLKATFASLSGSTTDMTIERITTLRDSQRILREAFGKSEEFEAGVVLGGRVFTRGDDTPFEFAPDGSTIAVVFKRPKPKILCRHGF